MLTSTPYWMVPIVWIGPFIYCMTLGNWTESFLETCVYFLLGNGYWTIFEYVFHRYLLHSENHWLPNHPQAMAFHFLLHGVHHSFPHDKYHLVFPIVPGYIALNIVMYPLKLYLPEHIMGSVCAGFMFAYVYYDMVHYWFHNSSPQNGYMKSLKAHHMQHHYRDGKMGFGISSRFWDHVFWTDGRLQPAKVEKTVELKGPVVITK
jgi:4-hydroxysphinganine ceramide fatty acyl 2-hydroxylase